MDMPKALPFGIIIYASGVVNPRLHNKQPANRRLTVPPKKWIVKDSWRALQEDIPQLLRSS